MSLNPFHNDSVHPSEGAFGVVCTFCVAESKAKVCHYSDLMGIALLNPSYELGDIHSGRQLVLRWRYLITRKEVLKCLIGLPVLLPA